MVTWLSVALSNCCEPPVFDFLTCCAEDGDVGQGQPGGAHSAAGEKGKVHVAKYSAVVTKAGRRQGRVLEFPRKIGSAKAAP